MMPESEKKNFFKLVNLKDVVRQDQLNRIGHAFGDVLEKEKVRNIEALTALIIMAVQTCLACPEEERIFEKEQFMELCEGMWNGYSQLKEKRDAK